MPEPYQLDDSAGIRLMRDDYRADFRTRQWTISGQPSWKLERRQHFRELGFASWEAFAVGDWDEALRLIEAERDFLIEFSSEAESKEIPLYRLRVVERPIDPYLQWELHLLNLRAECGELIRVIEAEQIREQEAERPLPELVTLGRSTLYRVLYNDEGESAGAVRFSSPDVVWKAERFIRELYEQGEDLTVFSSVRSCRCHHRWEKRRTKPDGQPTKVETWPDLSGCP
ncbi:DUF6879 family protein [Spongiactinospora sp. TRM90649]|uniref:DUF6879 family protein n=1 Tax=Spongiactinospora sp. TRM90649 TaxID=3031114 RepID=UPI0023F71A43|nr:DUF6879 family protein [Spongiactinospora sp. TRM90649]MDF5755559.1 hypothetical protein [Spongiactinospora sp. TRM90649]